MLDFLARIVLEMIFNVITVKFVLFFRFVERLYAESIFVCEKDAMINDWKILEQIMIK